MAFASKGIESPRCSEMSSVLPPPQPSIDETVSQVAVACFAGHQLEIARAGGSRRALGKKVDIPGKVIAEIEAATRVPTPDQVASLTAALPALDVASLDQAAQLQGVPWLSAVTYLQHGMGLTTLPEMSDLIAAQCRPLDAAAVSWRLRRQLETMDTLPSEKLAPRSMESCQRADEGWPAPLAGSSLPTRLERSGDAEVDAFFYVVDVAGEHTVTLNESHPLFPLFSLVLGLADSQEQGEATEREVAGRQLVLHLLGSWADHELNEKAGSRRDAVRELRHRWGKAARTSNRSWPPPTV